MPAAPDPRAAAPVPSLVPQGPHAGQRPMTLNRLFTLIGSAPSARLFLPSKSVSRCHAVIINSDTGFFVRDLASRTMVLVNGQPVRESDLDEGDTIQIGPFTFRFTDPDARRRSKPVAPTEAALEVEGLDEPIRVDERLVLIGRRETADVSLTENSASSAHAVIIATGGGHVIRDLNSRTGTFINGAKIHEHVLSPGDTIRVGETTMRYARDRAAPLAPPAAPTHAPTHAPAPAAPARAEATAEAPSEAPALEELSLIEPVLAGPTPAGPTPATAHAARTEAGPGAPVAAGPTAADADIAEPSDSELAAPTLGATEPERVEESPDPPPTANPSLDWEEPSAPAPSADASAREGIAGGSEVPFIDNDPGARRAGPVEFASAALAAGDAGLVKSESESSVGRYLDRLAAPERGSSPRASSDLSGEGARPVRPPSTHPERPQGAAANGASDDEDALIPLSTAKDPFEAVPTIPRPDPPVPPARGGDDASLAAAANAGTSGTSDADLPPAGAAAAVSSRATIPPPPPSPGRAVADESASPRPAPAASPPRAAAVSASPPAESPVKPSSPPPRTGWGSRKARAAAPARAPAPPGSTARPAAAANSPSAPPPPPAPPPAAPPRRGTDPKPAASRKVGNVFKPSAPRADRPRSPFDLVPSSDPDPLDELDEDPGRRQDGPPRA